MKIFHMYGPNDSFSKFIPSMIYRMKNNECSIDVTLGNQTRDFIYIDDVVEAYSSVLNKFQIIKQRVVEFEVGTGTETSIKALLLLIKKLTSSSSTINFGLIKYGEHEIMSSKAENENLIALGWKPNYDINKGLQNTLEQKY